MKNSLRRILPAILALALLATSALAEQSADQPRVFDQSLLSLTTGLPTDKAYKPIQMTLDNEPGARPQIGMSRADVVYEFECYTGGYTRYLAIFNDDVPEKAEGCRSTRMPALEMYWNFGGAVVHFGGWNRGEADVNTFMDKLNLDAEFNGLKGDPHFHRDKNRKMPHNAVAELQSIAEDTPEVEERQMLRFSAENPSIKGRDVIEFCIPYRKDYKSSYKYNADSRLYEYYFNGKRAVDGLDSMPLSFSNVIVIKHAYWFADGRTNTPMIDSTGTHTVEYFIGGKHFTGTCERESIFETTRFFDDEGNEVQFLPGKTFIHLPDEKREIEYIA